MIKDKYVKLRITDGELSELKSDAIKKNITISDLLRNKIGFKNEKNKLLHKHKILNVKLYLTDFELNSLTEKKNQSKKSFNKIISMILRKNLQSKQKFTEKELIEIDKLSNQVYKIGVNINTIARFCNEQSKLDKFKFPWQKQVELEPLLKNYIDKQEQITNILKKVRLYE